MPSVGNLHSHGSLTLIQELFGTKLTAAAGGRRTTDDGLQARARSAVGWRARSGLLSKCGRWLRRTWTTAQSSFSALKCSAMRSNTKKNSRYGRGGHQAAKFHKTLTQTMSFLSRRRVWKHLEVNTFHGLKLPTAHNCQASFIKKLGSIKGGLYSDRRHHQTFQRFLLTKPCVSDLLHFLTYHTRQ